MLLHPARQLRMSALARVEVMCLVYIRRVWHNLRREQCVSSRALPSHLEVREVLRRREVRSVRRREGHAARVQTERRRARCGRTAGCLSLSGAAGNLEVEATTGTTTGAGSIAGARTATGCGLASGCWSLEETTMRASHRRRLQSAHHGR